MTSITAFLVAPTPLSHRSPRQNALHVLSRRTQALPIHVRLRRIQLPPHSNAPSPHCSIYTTPTYTGDDVKDLLESIRYDDYDTFQTLIERLPDGVNTVFKHKSSQSALLAACFRGRTRMIRYLIVHGADCMHRNQFDVGAVFYCKQYYWPLKMVEEGEEMVRLLKKNGATEEEGRVTRE